MPPQEATEAVSVKTRCVMQGGHAGVTVCPAAPAQRAATHWGTPVRSLSQGSPG